jgi:Domain of unknown function (DUF4158)
LTPFLRKIAESDLIRYFTLLGSDLEFVRRQRGDYNRLGFTFQICALRYLGFAPDDLTTAPPTAISFLADQLRSRQRYFIAMERDPKLARIICRKFSSTWDFVTQRAKIYAHSPTGCWHALWNTTSRGCCFSSRASICALRKSFGPVSRASNG